jgi:hypothetical protein
MTDTGYKLLKRAEKFNFLKWGEYMKRAQVAERKIEKLKRLILLTDPVVSGAEMNILSARQWNAFIEEFPEEMDLGV